MTSLQSDSSSFRTTSNQQQVQQPQYPNPSYQQQQLPQQRYPNFSQQRPQLQQQQYMVCLVTNKPKYHKPCTYNLTTRGCKFGQNCWFQHFIQQPPQQQQHLLNPTAITQPQIDLKSLTNQLYFIVYVVFLNQVIL
eukprot:545977_1